MDELILKNEKYFYNNFDNYLSYNSSNYLKARKYIGICNNYNYKKIMIYGTRAINLINSISSKPLDESKIKSCYTLIMNKKKLISEVLVLKLSALRYLLVYENSKKLYKYLNKVKRKFPLTTINDVSNKYSIFSFHGEESNNFFNKLKSQNLYKTNRQGYTHYQLIVNKKNESGVVSYFKNLNFIPINLETKAIFLYNNNVITNLNNIKKRWKNFILDILYKSNKLNLVKKENPYEIKQFELQDNVLAFKNSYIYSSKFRKAGIIHCSYKVPNKKYPFIICFVTKNKITKTAIFKHNKKEILLKQFIHY